MAIEIQCLYCGQRRLGGDAKAWRSIKHDQDCRGRTSFDRAMQRNIVIIEDLDEEEDPSVPYREKGSILHDFMERDTKYFGDL